MARMSYRQYRDLKNDKMDREQAAAEAQTLGHKRRLPPQMRSMRAMVSDRARRKETPK
jgi:hypothetical protein